MNRMHFVLELMVENAVVTQVSLVSPELLGLVLLEAHTEEK